MPSANSKSYLASQQHCALRASWAITAAPMLPEAAVREPTLLFVNEKDFSVRFPRKNRSDYSFPGTEVLRKIAHTQSWTLEHRSRSEKKCTCSERRSLKLCFRKERT